MSRRIDAVRSCNATVRGGLASLPALNKSLEMVRRADRSQDSLWGLFGDSLHAAPGAVDWMGEVFVPNNSSDKKPDGIDKLNQFIESRAALPYKAGAVLLIVLIVGLNAFRQHHVSTAASSDTSLTVHVSSDPEGAEVFVKGVALGVKTPGDVKIRDSEISEVTVQKSGYEQFSVDKRELGELVSLDFSMRPKLAP